MRSYLTNICSWCLWSNDRWPVAGLESAHAALAWHPKTPLPKTDHDERVKEGVHLSLPFSRSTGKHAKKQTPEKDPVTHANMDTTHADSRPNQNKAMLDCSLHCMAAQARAGKFSRWVLECIISKFYCVSEMTINKVLQQKDNIYSDYTGWFITCSARHLRWSHGQQINCFASKSKAALTFFMSLLFMGSSDILYDCSSIISFSS